jgi:hypothetical protein
VTRKQFLALCVAAPIVSAQPPTLYGAKEEQEFAQKFDSWVTLCNKNGDIVDVKEIRAWHETTHAWSRLKQVIDPLYK